MVCVQTLWKSLHKCYKIGYPNSGPNNTFKAKKLLIKNSIKQIYYFIKFGLI